MLHRLKRCGSAAIIAAAFASIASEVVAANATAKSEDLMDLSLEELSSITISSVSGHAERLSDAPASVFVITSDDIRRSGATSLPEALRLAPNLQVAQATASGYAITARGFNNSAANKLLVLVDGRSVYSPLFSGVFWDAQDVMLEDVDRIEVISGPGATLWGANAVNGVINVMTRSAKRTQGGLASIGTGNDATAASLRYGAKAGEDGHYRVYGKYSDSEHGYTSNGTSKDDAWRKTQAGFRADWDRAGDQLMIQGNAYKGQEAQPFPGVLSVSGISLALGSIPISGANLTTRWSHALDGGSNVVLQAYYDRTERTVPPTFADTLDMFDVQFQHLLRPIQMHTLSWGGEYRQGMDHVTNSAIVAFLPADVTQKWASVFAQDEMELQPNLRLTVGSRMERNDYTGNEFLPSARLAWKPAPDRLLWLSSSRTVRAPSRLDRDTHVPGTAPFLLAGGSAVRSEVATVHELGYRGQPTTRSSFSVTVFRAFYDHLRTQEIAPSRTFLVYASEMEGTSTGIEMWGSFQATRAWRLSSGFTGLREVRRLKPGSNDVTAVGTAGLDPAQTWMVRSSFDLSGDSEFDALLRHVASLSNPSVPGYMTLDLRYAWKPRRDLELSLNGQNLAGKRHAEFTDPVTAGAFGPAVFMKMVSRF